MAIVASGLVKSFSIRNGYGFITDVAGGEDLFFSKDQIPVEWHALGPKLEGQEVVYEVGQSAEGRAQARNLRPAQAPQINQTVAGVVRSYNSTKGFGFMQTMGVDGDIFFARDRLPAELQSVSHLEGATLVYQLAQGPDGKFQAQNISAPQGQPIMEHGGGMRAKRPFSDSLEPAKRMNFGGGAAVTINGIGTRQTGIVKSYSTKNGFGFILSNSASEDIIFFGRDCAEGEPNQGDSIEFTMQSNAKGRPQAHDVKPAGANGAAVTQPTSQGLAQYPVLTVDDLKLYADQLNTQDLSELNNYTSQVLQTRL